MVCTSIAKPQTCKHCRKIPPIQKSYQKKEYAKKIVRNMLFIFTKKKNRHHTSHCFFHKTSCTFCWTWESLPAGTVAADSQHSALSTEPSHARKTWIQEKAQNHAPPAFPNINNNQRSGKRRKTKTKKQKRRTKKKKNRTRMPLRRYSPSGSKMLE